MRTSAFFVMIAMVMADLVRAAPPETVPVGSPGNPADGTGFGAVPYAYRIGKHEVTNAQYCDFLNRVASKDSHGLYDSRMADEYGGILRAGTEGRYSYRIKPGMGAKPVNFVRWESCLRYANWLSGGQVAGGTDTGAYVFKPDGSVVVPDHVALAAGKVVRWVLPSENEWYKAAYYDPAKPRGGGYWPYPARGDSAPDCNLNSNAPSDVGSFKNAPSPFGTFDQAGNLWEFNDRRAGHKVGLRGGSFYINDHAGYTHATARYEVDSAPWPNYGFRVAVLGGGASAASPMASRPVEGAPVVPAPGPTPVVAAPASPAARSKPAAAKRPGGPKVFYVSQSTGNDQWSGDASSPAGGRGPWKTLARASVDYFPGDVLMLKRGDVWDEELRPLGSGTPEAPISIGSYGEGARPLIDRQDYTKDLCGIRLSDQEGFRIFGIEFARCMTGIYAEYSAGSPERRFIRIEDCVFRDALHYQPYQDYPKRKIGLGICFFSHETANKVVLRDITIQGCVFRRLASGVWTNSPDNFNKNASFVYNFANLNLADCLFEEGYQWQMGIRGVAGGTVRRCVTVDVGRGFRSFNGVAGGMFFRCKDWVFEDSEWGFVDIGLGSGDGQAFDFEGNCDNMVMRRCLFHDSDGPGFLLCCYASDGNPNTKILMENCVLNGKAKRPIGLPRCEIVNTTDWNECEWRSCRFYLAEGVVLTRVMDPEKDKRSSWTNCVVKDLRQACSGTKLAARVSASSQVVGGEANKVSDGQEATAWKPGAKGASWVQLDFAAPTRVNEFKLGEEASSSVNRYFIEYWDEAQRRWQSCFHGLAIGKSFVAPIVERTTSKVRLQVLRSERESVGITTFEAYHDAGGEVFSVPRGQWPDARPGR